MANSRDYRDCVGCNSLQSIQYLEDMVNCMPNAGIVRMLRTIFRTELRDPEMIFPERRLWDGSQEALELEILHEISGQESNECHSLQF
jgi:hypothetical protein